MARVLVCLNDGLLKTRIIRILGGRNIPYSVTDKPISRNDLLDYGVLIVHSSYKLNDLFSFIENLVVQKQITVMYLTTNVNSNPFRKFVQHPNLIFVDETKMDVELPYALELHSKYQSQIETLSSDKQKLVNKVDTLDIMIRCKRNLMSIGYTEDTAHKYILKYAMDNHISKNEACKRLLGLDSK